MATRLEANLNRAILGTFAAGFIAWAGIVWDAREELSRVLSEVAVMDNRLKHIEARLMHHEEQRWHGEAGNAIATLRARLADVERRLP